MLKRYLLWTAKDTFAKGFIPAFTISLVVAVTLIITVFSWVPVDQKWLGFIFVSILGWVFGGFLIGLVQSVLVLKWLEYTPIYPQEVLLQVKDGQVVGVGDRFWKGDGRVYLVRMPDLNINGQFSTELYPPIKLKAKNVSFQLKVQITFQFKDWNQGALSGFNLQELLSCLMYGANNSLANILRWRYSQALAGDPELSAALADLEAHPDTNLTAASRGIQNILNKIAARQVVALTNIESVEITGNLERHESAYLQR